MRVKVHVHGRVRTKYTKKIQEKDITSHPAHPYFDFNNNKILNLKGPKFQEKNSGIGNSW